MSHRIARATALLIVVLAVGLTIRYNGFVLWATDSGAYVSAAHAWADADLFEPASFVFWAPWDATGHVEAPLGHRPGPAKGTITGIYPLGYPVLLALAITLGGPLALHLISPLLLGVLIWCAFVIARQLSTAWAGVIAALLIAGTPVTALHTLMPMSDVPAAAFWAVAWAMSLRTGIGATAAAGAAAAMAIMIRPNLAPLGVVIAAAAIAADRPGVAHVAKRLATLATTAAIGPVMVMWSQALLYGHPLQPGYLASLDVFFRAERIPVNARAYIGMLLDLHSWVIFAAFMMVPLAIYRAHRGQSETRQTIIVLSALGLILVNYALYLPYLTYRGWFWLRFLLPGLLALFVLFAGLLDRSRLWLTRRWRWAGAVIAVPVLFVFLTPRHLLVPPAGQDRLQLMGHYLRAVLPPRAVILTFAHGGAISVYTGAPIVRLDLIDPASLDSTIADLQRHGHRPVFVLDLAIESGMFTDRFKNSDYVALDWPARAEFASGFSITYHDVLDRDAFLSGERWPVDVLLGSHHTTGATRWADYRAQHERLLLPWAADTTRFRSTLETIYRDELGRAAVIPTVDPDSAVKWLRRYLRYRVHECGHDDAVAKVFAQLDGAAAPPLCGRPGALVMPSRSETLAFRRQLDDRLRGAPSVKSVPTFVDLEGEAVWLQEYLHHRMENCSHEEAAMTVLRQIRGDADARCPRRTGHGDTDAQRLF